MASLQEKHRQAFELITQLNDFEHQWSKYRNELIELGAFENGKATIDRLHQEMLQVDKVVSDKLNDS